MTEFVAASRRLNLLNTTVYTEILNDRIWGYKILKRVISIKVYRLDRILIRIYCFYIVNKYILKSDPHNFL